MIVLKRYIECANDHTPYKIITDTLRFSGTFKEAEDKIARLKAEEKCIKAQWRIYETKR